MVAEIVERDRLGSFQLIRFKLIGKPYPDTYGHSGPYDARFQLIRFKLIGKP